MPTSRGWVSSVSNSCVTEFHNYTPHQVAHWDWKALALVHAPLGISMAWEALLLWKLFCKLALLVFFGLPLVGSKSAGGLSPSPDHYLDGIRASVGHAFVLLIKALKTGYCILGRWHGFLYLPFDEDGRYRWLLLRWHSSFLIFMTVKNVSFVHRDMAIWHLGFISQSLKLLFVFQYFWDKIHFQIPPSLRMYIVKVLVYRLKG